MDATFHMQNEHVEMLVFLLGRNLFSNLVLTKSGHLFSIRKSEIFETNH